jgi:hypothetical protein
VALASWISQHSKVALLLIFRIGCFTYLTINTCKTSIGGAQKRESNVVRSAEHWFCDEHLAFPEVRLQFDQKRSVRQRHLLQGIEKTCELA